MTTNTRVSIQDYVCNLIAGQRKIMSLYNAVENALWQKNIGGRSCFKFNLPCVGCKSYSGPELVRLYNLSFCTTVEEVGREIVGDKPTVDQAVLLLLIARLPITCLYSSYIKSLYMYSTVRKYCYTFINPFVQISDVNRPCITYTGAQLREVFCVCNDPAKFNACLIWNGLPVHTV